MLEEAETLEEVELLINDSNTSNKKNSVWNSLKFYIRQTKIIDWVISGIIIGAIIITIIFCV
jgi:hypothetical protein